MKLKKTFSILLILTTGILSAQNDKLTKFENRDVSCYSVEVGILLSNEGKSRNNIENNETVNSETTRKYFEGVQIIIDKTSKDYGDLKNWEKGKDIVLTTLSEAASNRVPGSSIILEPLMKYVEYEREERIRKFENKSIGKVNLALELKFKEILGEGSSQDLKKIIYGNDPIFVFEDNKVKYNRELIKAVDKRSKVERDKIWTELNSQEKKITDLYDKNAKVVAEIAQVELNAIYAYESNKKAINFNIKKIQVNVSNIKENRRLTEQNALRLSILSSTVVNHEIRITKNTDEIQNVKLSLLWDRSSVEDKIQGLESGDFNHLFIDKDGNVDDLAISKLVQETKEMKIRKDIYEGAEEFSQWGKVASQLFSGIDPDLSKAIDTGVQVSDIVGSFAAQNYPQAAMGVLSLVGVGSKPGPSQETVLLKRVLKELDGLRESMNDRFDEVDLKLDKILGSVNNIQTYLEAMNQDIQMMQIENQKQFGLINEKLDQINNKLDNIESKQSDIILSLINGCNLPSKQINNSKAKDLKELRKIRRKSGCYKCVDALENFINKGELSFSDFDQATKIKEGLEGIVEEDVYKKILKLWKNKWSIKYDDSYQSLLYPPKYTHQNLKLFTRLVNERDSLNTKQYQLLDNDLSSPLKSPLIVSRISNYFLTMYPFLELYVDGEFIKYNDIIENDVEVTETSLFWFLNYIIEIVDYSIAQQSILSGHLMLNEIERILYYGDDNELKLLDDILENNPILLHNFINNLLNVDIDRIIDGDSTIILDKTNSLSISLDKSDINTWKLSIKKSRNSGEEFEFNYGINPINDKNYKSQFILSQNFYLLQDVKNRLLQKKNELLFASQIKAKIDDISLNAEEFKNILINNNYDKN
ncbi:hypothetical protein V2598_06440 [Tenacibaculum maritimum]|uniref:hypothetical protein n=1 Tax=Tenacibaculum maritimum TaxID=107401 RepID=UPI003877657C